MSAADNENTTTGTHEDANASRAGSRRAKRSTRSLATWAIVRSTGTAALLVWIYYLLPLDGLLHGASLGLLIVALAALTLLLVWQVRSIARSPYPRIRAMESLSAAVPLLLLTFATTYVLMAQANGGAFSESISRTGGMYFSVTVFATVGFGDIVPVTDSARIVVTSQMIVDLILIGLGLRVILGAIQIGDKRRSSS